MSDPAQPGVVTTERHQPSTEVRLALVCYGGVSLAIYMHGITKELNKLIRAARAFDAAYEADPTLTDVGAPFAVGTGDGDEIDTERAYFDALVRIARVGTPLRVVLDVITGTSAGGINGVFLGHALAHDRSLAPLRDLWLQRADINQLLDARPHLQGAGTLLRAYLMTSALARTVWARHGSRAPLSGDLMSRLVHEALGRMGPARPSLVPPDSSLDMIITGTSVHGRNRAIPTGEGGVAVEDRVYQQVLQFRWEQGRAATGGAGTAAVDNFTDADVPALGFAARVTSSFPGAFTPVSLSTFTHALHGAPGAVADPERIVRSFGFGDTFTGTDVHDWYMDGGVLDNGPFDHAIDLIAGKRAEGRVARELVFIDPDPHPPAALPADPTQPPWLTVIGAATITIPNRQVFLGALDRIQSMNAAIHTIGALVQQQEDEVNRVLPPQLGVTSGYRESLTSGAEVRDRARDLAGLTYGSYCRLRAEGVATEIGSDLADALGYARRSDRARFIGEVAAAWVRGQDYWLAPDPTGLEDAVGPVDAAFRRRRVQFLLQGINTLLAARTHSPSLQGDLRSFKGACWDLLETLRSLTRSAVADQAVRAATEHVLGPTVLDRSTILSDPVAFAAGHRAALSAVFTAYRKVALFHTSSEQLWSTYLALNDTDPAWQALGLRYLMYPIWDALVFPLIELSGLPQLSTIHVRRFSPEDAHGLTAVDPSGQPAGRSGAKLQSTAVHNFGGFFNKEWRENDYLWGRLDGVELIMKLLGDHGQATDLSDFVRSGWTSALDTETSVLTALRPKIDALREQIVASPSVADLPTN